jgi:hypothetical protein
MTGVEYMKVHRRKKENSSRKIWEGLSHGLISVALVQCEPNYRLISNCDRLLFVSDNRSPEAKIYSDRLEN